MEKLLFGATVALIGIGTVFFELTLLVFVIKLISAVTKYIERFRVPKAKESAASGVTPTLTASISKEQGEPSELIAVITAAVACFSDQTVQIKTIRRISGEQAEGWSLAGRQDTMGSRQFI